MSAVLQAGDLCEARYLDDDLYFAGVVVRRNADGASLRILFDDGDVEDVPAADVLPFGRAVVFSSEEVLVQDGHLRVAGEVRDVRLLMFASSPQLYQSALVLSRSSSSSGGKATLCPELLAFDYTQALCLAGPLHALLVAHAHAHADDTAAARGAVGSGGGGGGGAVVAAPVDEEVTALTSQLALQPPPPPPAPQPPPPRQLARVVTIGGGAGVVPLALARLFPTLFVDVGKAPATRYLLMLSRSSTDSLLNRSADG